MIHYAIGDRGVQLAQKGPAHASVALFAGILWGILAPCACLIRPRFGHGGRSESYGFSIDDLILHIILRAFFINCFFISSISEALPLTGDAML